MAIMSIRNTKSEKENLYTPFHEECIRLQSYFKEPGRNTVFPVGAFRQEILMKLQPCHFIETLTISRAHRYAAISNQHNSPLD